MEDPRVHVLSPSSVINRLLELFDAFKLFSLALD